MKKPQAEFSVTDKADKENHGMGLAEGHTVPEKWVQ